MEKEGVIVSSSIKYLIKNEPEDRLEVGAIDSMDSSFFNPIICFSRSNSIICHDAISLIGIYLKFSKSNCDKKKTSFFIRQFFIHFLQIKPEDRIFQVTYETSEDLKRSLSELEKSIYPTKEFYYHKKIDVEIEEENIKTVAEMISSENCFNDFLTSENPFIKNDDPASLTTPLTDKNVPNGEKEIEAPKAVICENEQRHKNNPFFASYQFFVTFKYFFIFYERLEFAFHFSMNAFNDKRVYQAFLNLLIFHIFGIIDSQSYENSILVLFNKKGGVLLNMDKIIQNLLKSVPSDEL